MTPGGREAQGAYPRPDIREGSRPSLTRPRRIVPGTPTESVSREVSDFDIHLTLVEPGATRTGFASALRYTTETAVYRDNAVGRTRRYLETADESVLTGDPAKLAAAIYDTTRHPRPPLRLTLGSDTYSAIHAALTERLTALETQKDLAESVAFTR
ncbi:hypothetical protein ACGF5T_18885 [Streptomyces sp. NPDC047853]|uniref:hypothetical protein n=1 Tax=unclassified Streptomyces TaxID=2593676 RepID=UPI00345691BD